MSMYVLLCPCCICCGIVDKEGAIKGNLQIIIRGGGDQSGRCLLLLLLLGDAFIYMLWDC